MESRESGEGHGGESTRRRVGRDGERRRGWKVKVGDGGQGSGRELGGEGVGCGDGRRADDSG